jgi:hypothetical protein
LRLVEKPDRDSKLEHFSGVDAHGIAYVTCGSERRLNFPEILTSFWSPLPPEKSARLWT